MTGNVRVAVAWSVLLVGLFVGTAALMAQPGADRAVGEFTTSLSGRTSAQRHNARLSAQRLNGAVVLPGETFSFNRRVGGWSRDRGYRKAPVSYNGQLIDSYGGGVCQTSTTLYNAALLAGLPIDERHSHRFHATYAPPGRDAAVAYEGVDLKFTNTTGVPLRIVAGVRGDLLVVGLHGQVRPPRPGAEVRIVSEVREVVRPTSFVLESDRPGTRVRNGGKRGFEVSTYREIGGRRELISVDSYPVMHRVLEKGVASLGQPAELE